MSDFDLVPSFPVTPAPPEDAPGQPPTPNANTLFSRPVWVHTDPADLVLFYCKDALFAYKTDGTLQYYIPAQVAITGFAVAEGLFVQDGNVLCQYNLIQQDDYITYPTYALAFGPADAVTEWSSTDGNGNGSGSGSGAIQASFDALFTGTSTGIYSAPVIFIDQNNDKKVYVLRSDGKVFAAHTDCTEARFSQGHPLHGPDQPDQPGGSMQPTLYWDASAAGGARLCFISGGQVVVLPDNRVETPSDIQEWRWNCLMNMSDQPWMPLTSLPGFIGSVTSSNSQAASGQATAITLFDPTTGNWTLHIANPPCVPVLSGAGSMQVQDGSSGAIVTISNPAISLGQIVSPPPTPAQEWSGTLPVGQVLSAPNAVVENGVQSVYLIATGTTGGNVPALYKFVAEVPSNLYFLCWWKGVQATHAALQPTLRPEIISVFADLTQEAIDNGTLPGGFAQATYSSPLWSATQQGSVPWDKFGPAALTYVPLYSAGAGGYVEQIDTSFVFSSSTALVFTLVQKPAVPLFGPRPFRQASQLILSNRYGLYGFAPEGNLLWRIPSRGSFQGWIPIGYFLLIAEQGILSLYNSSNFPSDGSAVLYPDQTIDLQSPFAVASTPVAPVDPGNFDSLIGRGQTWVGADAIALPTFPASTYVPYYLEQPSLPNYSGPAIGLHAGQQDFLIGFDPSQGLVPSAYFSNSTPFSNPDSGLQVDLSVDAPRINWRPQSPVLPAGLNEVNYKGVLVPIDPTLNFVSPTAGLQIDTSGGPIDVCDPVVFGGAPNSDMYLYCCLARGEQYYWARILIPIA